MHNSSLAAFAAGAATALLGASVLLWRLSDRGGSQSRAPKSSVATTTQRKADTQQQKQEEDDDDDTLFCNEQLSRHRAFFGDVSEDAIERAFVVVVGVGGVGSHAAHLISRAGVSRLRLIDFDNVSLSSLNRHATANRADVGTPKVTALAAAIREYMPRCRVEAVQRIFEGKFASELLLDADGASKPDFVLDCIDDVETKAALLAFCVARNIRVVSSLGAGGKSDPTRLCLGDLNEVRKDPLGVALRMQLRKTAPLYGATALRAALGGGGDNIDSTNSSKEERSSGGVMMTGITCVYSTELTRVKLLPLELDAAAGDKPQDFGALAGFRSRVLPVLGPVPSAFGICLASYVLCELAGKPIELPRRIEPVPPGAVTKLLKQFSAWTQQRYGSLHYALNAAYAAAEANEPPSSSYFKRPSLSLVLSSEEAEFLIDEAWHSRSPVSKERLGTRGVSLQLCRWRPHRPSLPSNVVLLSDEEALALHDATAAAVQGVLGQSGVSSFGLDKLQAALDDASHAAAEGVFGKNVAQAVVDRLRWVADHGW